MSKYEKIGKIPTQTNYIGWYEFGAYKGYRFENGICIDRCKKGGTWHYIVDSKFVNRESMKAAFKVRTSPLYKIIYGDR